MRFLLCTIALVMTCSVSASDINALTNCYTYAKIMPPSNNSIETELFVVIDQTTPLDLNLQQSVANQLKPLLKEGNAFSVIVFSAFIQNHYTDILVSAHLNSTLEKNMRDDIGKPQLVKFDDCMSRQIPKATALAGTALKKAFSGTTADMTKSDIFASLKTISEKVKQSTAKRKIILLASDMLENSSISSFYAKQSVRKIDSTKELNLVKDNQLLGNFGNADIYVIGAGLITESTTPSKSIYRDPKIMSALEDFWRNYFASSNANLIEFGKPTLLNSIR